MSFTLNLDGVTSHTQDLGAVSRPGNLNRDDDDDEEQL